MGSMVRLSGTWTHDGRAEMEEVPVDVARWAVGAGLPVIAEVAASLRDGDDVLAVGTRLRRTVDPARAAFVTMAAATRLRAVAAGVPGAEDLVLTREALEQASHPAAAAWRARRAALGRSTATDDVVQDRCAGTGGDAVALAEHGPVLALERDPGRAVLAAHRAAVLGAPVVVRVGDALDPAWRCRGAVVHADPDRRDARGRRARTLAQHHPPVAELVTATRAAAGRLLTVAPGVAWDDPALPLGAEVVFLQHGRDLLEAVLCTGAAARGGVRATAVLLEAGETLHRGTKPRARLEVGPVGTHLLRPATAAVRARLHDGLGARVGARRIAEHRALLTSDEAPPTSPWFDVEPVLAVTTTSADSVRSVLPADARVEVLLHGLDVDVARFLRDLGGPATGPDDVRIHLVRRDDDAVAIVTRSTA